MKQSLLFLFFFTLFFAFAPSSSLQAQSKEKYKKHYKKKHRKGKKKKHLKRKRKKQELSRKVKKTGTSSLKAETTRSPSSKLPTNKAFAANEIIIEAKRHLGTKYRYGGESPKGFDCSGYTQYVFKKTGIDISRTSKTQAREGQRIKINEAQKGDLLFFAKNGKTISHVGIVISDKNESLKMIHSSSSGVNITSIKSSRYWKNKLRFARRIL